MTIQTTTIPTVIDALLALIRSLNLTYGTDPIEVFDGLAGPNIPDVYVQIGGVEQTTADGSQTWASIGSAPGVAPARDERYSVNLAVFAYVGGTDADVATADDAQNTARNAAFAVVTAIESAVRTNPMLLSANDGADGLLPNGLGTGWIEFGGHVELQQTTAEDAKAAMGRQANVLFQIGVFARLRSI